VSGSSLGDGLKTTLIAASAFDSGNVSLDDYGIMTTSNTCALIITPGGMSAERHAYGESWERTWDLEIEAYVKYTGDAQKALHNVWKLADEVIGAVYADQNLSSSACSAIVSDMDRPRNVEVEMGGNTWLPLYFTIEVMEVA